MSKINLNRVWDDAKAMGKANRDLLTAIAGMFILLPIVLALQFLEAPAPPASAADPEAINSWYRALVAANWHILLGVSLATSYATLAILVLLLRQDRLTVAESLKAASLVLPGYMLAGLLQNLALNLGILLFIVPAMYMIGRFALVSAACAAEQIYNPVTMIVRSVMLTRGNGWRIFGMLAVIAVVGGIVSLVAMLMLGLFAELLLPGDLANVLTSLVVGLLLTAILLVFLLVYAALYRAASATPAAAPRWPGLGF